MAVRNAWYVAAWTPDLAADRPYRIDILGEPIVLWRAGAKICAFEDRCVHRQTPLSRGRIEGDSLRCLYHGFLFDADGRVTAIPGQDIIPPKACVRVYPVVERHSWAWVWMGDPAKADETLIATMIGLDDPDYALAHGYLDYQAEADLICDNLLDLSHVPFIHASSFNPGMTQATNVPTITTVGRGVRFGCWLPDRPAGDPMLPGSGPNDTYMTYDFLVPGTLHQKMFGLPLGTAARMGDGLHEFEPGSVNGLMVSNQAVTPTGPKTARYFFSIGTHSKFGGAKEAEIILSITNKAFAEDKAMIEAQQKLLDMTPNRSVMPSAHDRGVMLYGRLVERMAQAEA